MKTGEEDPPLQPSSGALWIPDPQEGSPLSSPDPPSHWLRRLSFLHSVALVSFWKVT